MLDRVTIGIYTCTGTDTSYSGELAGLYTYYYFIIVTLSILCFKCFIPLTLPLCNINVLFSALLVK